MTRPSVKSIDLRAKGIAFDQPLPRPAPPCKSFPTSTHVYSATLQTAPPINHSPSVAFCPWFVGRPAGLTETCNPTISRR